MSTTTSESFTISQTSSLTETLSELSNLTYRNSSIALTRNRGISTETQVYQYIQWSFVLTVFLAGTTGNILLFIILSDKKLKFLSYSVYLKCLAVSGNFDLCVALLENAMETFWLPNLMLMNTITCKLVTSLRFLVMTLSPWLVVGLTLDRYVCICFPLTRDKFCTRMKALIVCSSMVVLSVASVTPFLADVTLIGRQCVPSEGVRYYYLLLRLIISSLLPCLLILILNVLLIIQIQRSYSFRKMFMTSRSDSTSRQQDSSTRPLVLVCVLAFLTLLPLSVSDAIEAALTITGVRPDILTVNNRVRAFFILIYILNFGQNFYILIGSSSNYRDIIKRKLGGCRWGRNEQNQTRSQRSVAIGNDGVTGSSTLSLVSTAPGVATLSTEVNA